MRDLRLEKLASNLINYSVRLKKGEKILIQATDVAKPLVKELIKQAYNVGALPFVQIGCSSISRELFLGATKELFDEMADTDLYKMKKMDAFIAVSGIKNSTNLTDVSQDIKSLYNKHYVIPVHYEERINNTKWVVLTYPTDAMAQAANMSYEEYEDFYFKTSCLDYEKMDEAMTPLVNLMDKTNHVRIKGKGTDLSFSTEGMKSIKCSGQVNIPDGEIFTAPVIDSVQGFITYNTPAVYLGKTYDNIKLEFENGKIINASSSDSKAINKIFDIDEGARFVGEFAIGVNPYITLPMKNTLYDEKIAGSFHFTPGRAYDDCDNGNRSAIHWDLVNIQTPQYGGGEIFFDDVLIRKDGLFVLEELKTLNPDNLK